MSAENWNPYTVEYKPDPGDEWQDGSNTVLCNSLSLGVAPSFDNASFRYRYGTLLQAGESTYRYWHQANLDGGYVRVKFPGAVANWVGYILTNQDKRGGDEDDNGERRIAFGDQEYTAKDLSWFLHRKQVTTSHYYKDGTEVTETPRAVGFNVGSGDGRSLKSKPRGNKDTRQTNLAGGPGTNHPGPQPTFSETPEYTELWTAYDICKYLMTFQHPADSAGDDSPIVYDIDPDAEPFLDWYTPVISTEGRTLHQILAQVIDSRRGIYYWFEYVEDGVTTGVDQCLLKVTSGNRNPINLPSGESLPAAATQTDWNFDQDISVKLAIVNEDVTRLYSKVNVKGALRTTTVTLSVTDGNLEPAWTPAQKTAYDTAADSEDYIENDSFRKADKFQRVYSGLRLPRDWDGKSGDGDGAVKDFAMPDLEPGSTSVTANEEFNPAGLRILGTTRLKAGYAYADPTNPTTEALLGQEADFRKIFALIEHDGLWLYARDANGHMNITDSDSEALKYSYSIIPFEDDAGVLMKPSGGLPHVIGLNHFDSTSSGTASKTGVVPEVDYETVRLTCTLEMDSYVQGEWPNTPIPINVSPVQELVIYMGDRYRLDWMAKGTVYDFDKEGGPLKSNFAGPLQDDRALLEDLARLAYEWYSEHRATLSFEDGNITAGIPQRGTLIGSIGTLTDPSEDRINSTVTELTFSPEAGTTLLSTGFVELDVRGLV